MGGKKGSKADPGGAGRERQADPWGVQPGFLDALGRWKALPGPARAALHRALGAEDKAGPPDLGPLVIRQGDGWKGPAPATIDLEDGGQIRMEGRRPGHIPPGYHGFRDPVDGRERELIVAPGQCFLPGQGRAWGWSAQLYSLRSAGSWGLGDLYDLAELAQWAARQGAACVQVNPLCAPVPGLPQESSPYFPSSRRYRNPLYLRVEGVPGASAAGEDLEKWSIAGRALTASAGDGRLDRDEAYRLKLAALERIWERFGRDPRFDAYRREQGPDLDQWARHCALREHYQDHGGPGDWRHWEPGHRRPDSPEVARFAAERARRVDFHAWLQWLLDLQLERAGARIRILQDLPIGFSPDGADAWAWQDLLAPGMSVGAPPDEFNAQGQDWGLPPFIPHKLRAAGYRPFRKTLRAILRHAGGLRIDHVMGLFRLYWVPAGAGPAGGGYVRYPSRDLLGILALESWRARAFVVGEDLGTVEAGARAELARRRVLSNRVLWFEREKPERYPRLALAAASTHDLPTLAGFWDGSDAREQASLGMAPDAAGQAALARRIRGWIRMPEGGTAGEAIPRVYAALARSPSILVVASLEDAAAARPRPNLPGAPPERPNWSLPLPKGREELADDPLPAAIARAMRAERPSGWAADPLPPGAEREPGPARRSAEPAPGGPGPG